MEVAGPEPGLVTSGLNPDGQHPYLEVSPPSTGGGGPAPAPPPSGGLHDDWLEALII